MTLFGRNVFLVGENFHAASALTNELYLLKFQCHFAKTMQAASELLSSQPVDLILSNTYLPDGTGIGLLPALARLPVTAFLCLPVENSCLWLPAINGGKVCLGAPALRPLEFRRTLEELARCLPVESRISKRVPKARVA
jgi:response regulator RpfG family c-di-GMP phosphodiesterase